MVWAVNIENIHFYCGTEISTFIRNVTFNIVERPEICIVQVTLS
jgi:hypothetical protein